VCGCGTRIFGVTYDMNYTNTLRNMIDVDVNVDVVAWRGLMWCSHRGRGGFGAACDAVPLRHGYPHDVCPSGDGRAWV
jgi:hypothetical protein